jgi:hypothetical protein
MWAHGRAPHNHHGAGKCKKDGCDSEEPNVERTDPKIKQVASKKGATAHAVFTFKNLT